MLVTHMLMRLFQNLVLQTLAAARMLSPPGPVGQTHWGDSAVNNPAPATHSADAQLKVQPFTNFHLPFSNKENSCVNHGAFFLPLSSKN